MEAGDAKTLMDELMRHVEEKTRAWGTKVDWVDVEILKGARGTQHYKEDRIALAGAIYDAVRGGGFGETDVQLRS